MSEAGVAVQQELPIANAPTSQPAPERPRKFIIPPDPAPAASPSTETQNTETQAPSDTPEVAKPDTPDEAESKRAQRRIDRKIDKAYRQRAEAQARAEFLQQELEKVKQATPAQKVEGEPTLAQFDYDPEKYAAAKAEFAKTQATKEYETKQKTEAATAEQRRLLTNWQEQVDKAEDKYDDFQTIVGDIQPNSPFTAALMHAENGADIAYHLGKESKEAQRIASLPPLAQVFEIGKLAAKLSAEPEKPKAPSKAPAPITPITGVAPTATNEPTEQDTMDAWMKKRTKQVLAKRR